MERRVNAHYRTLSGLPEIVQLGISANHAVVSERAQRSDCEFGATELFVSMAN
jgi:hypothetical protein